MANIKSSIKDIDRIKKRTAVNRVRRTQMKHAVTRVRGAVTAGDKIAALVEFQRAEKLLQRMSHRPVVHKNTARRRIAMMARWIKAMQGAFEQRPMQESAGAVAQ